MSNTLIRPTYIGLNLRPSPFIELISAYDTHAGKGYFHPAPKGNGKRLKDCFVFYRGVKGKGCIKTVLGEFTLSEGEIILVRNAEKIALSAQQEWRFFSVFFYADGLQLPVNELFLSPFDGNDETLLQSVLSLLQTGEFVPSAKACALFQNLLCDFLLQINSTAETVDSYTQSMRDIARYIRDNLNDDLSVEHLSSRCGFSKNHFCNMFKRYFSITPKAYILHAKLEKARLLLTGTDMPVAEISTELCFYSPAHFAYAFKKEYGLTPLEYRKQR